MHAANRAAWDEASERYEGWLEEAVALIRSGGTNLFGVETRAHRRPPRPLPTGDPSPVRGRPRHAVALEPGGRRGRRRRLQPADARPRRAPQRGDRRAGALGPVRRARDPARPRRQRGPRVHRPRLAHLARRPRCLGGRDRAAPVARPAGSSCSRDIPAEWLFDADADGHWIATDYDYFGGAEASKGWAPEYIDRLSLAERDQSWKFARAWTLGEVITALLGADLRLEQVAEHPVDWWGGHADVRAEERGRIPLSFSVVGRKGA